MPLALPHVGSTQSRFPISLKHMRHKTVHMTLLVAAHTGERVVLRSSFSKAKSVRSTPVAIKLS